MMTRDHSHSLYAKVRLLAILCSLLLPFSLSSEIQAQDNQSSSALTFWKATLPGGNYIVSLSTISSVSYHQYLIESSLVVDEVTIDTTGNSLVRFYSISPISEKNPNLAGANLLNQGKELLDQVGDVSDIHLNEMVIKQYPVTTHAKTVEFRLKNKATVQSLYESISQSWERGRRGNFTAN